MSKVLIACEESQAVCIEFRALGVEAFSCDVQECSGGHPEWHIQGDVLEQLQKPWDMIIAFPPCTYLCGSGMHWTTRGLRDPQLTEDALEFVSAILNADCPSIALENPVGIISSRIRKPSQIIQPYQFGDDASKKTCLWLKGLPNLEHTERVAGRMVETPSGKTVERWSNQCDNYGQDKLPPSPERAKLRSKTYPGIARAMAEQWAPCLSDDYQPAQMELGL